MRNIQIVTKEEFARGVMPPLTEKYLGVIEQHPDIYTHYVEDNAVLDCVLEDGFLRVEYSREDNYLGKAIYTFPIKSGKYFPPKIGGNYIVFHTSQKHIHVVTGTETHCIDECLFTEDVCLDDYEIVPADSIDKIISEYSNEVDSII